MLISSARPYLSAAPPQQPPIQAGPAPAPVPTPAPAPAPPAPAPQNTVSLGKRIAATAGGVVGAAVTAHVAANILLTGSVIAGAVTSVLLPPGAGLAMMHATASGTTLGALGAGIGILASAVIGGIVAYKAVNRAALGATKRSDVTAQALRDGIAAVRDAKTCKQALAGGYQAGGAGGGVAGKITGSWLGGAQGFMGAAVLTAAAGGSAVPALVMGAVGGYLGCKAGGYVGKHVGTWLAGGAGAVVGSAAYGLRKP